MSDLDKKLSKAIQPLASGWKSWTHDQLDGTSYIQGELENIEQIQKNAIQAIKQAFIDEGWLDPDKFAEAIEQRADFNKRWNLMTGAEWLAKLRVEIGNTLEESYESRLVMKAARRVAGVDHD